MKIVITNGTNAVRLAYNDIVAPNIFSKDRVIMKHSVMQLRLSSDESYVEVIYMDGSKEEFSFAIFEGYVSNSGLYEALAQMIM